MYLLSVGVSRGTELLYFSNSSQVIVIATYTLRTTTERTTNLLDNELLLFLKPGGSAKPMLMSCFEMLQVNLGNLWRNMHVVNWRDCAPCVV